MKTKWDVEFEFEVGTAETHHLAFHWGRLLGDARVTVDGDQVFKQVRPFGLKRVRRYEVSVGSTEHHSVIIETRNALVAAGVRRQTFLVQVDGEYWHRHRRRQTQRYCTPAPTTTSPSVHRQPTTLAYPDAVEAAELERADRRQVA